jgi:importin subunit beta-1
VVATIASIEVPAGMWPDVVQALISNIATAPTPEAKQASYEALGYVCEECPSYLEKQPGASNMILNAIQAGMDTKETNPAIKLAATVALRHSLEFARTNFAKPTECKLIFAMVFAAAQCDNTPVRVAALACLVEIASLYYPHLKDYIPDAYQYPCPL